MYVKDRRPNLAIDRENMCYFQLKLHEDPHSRTQTFISRLVALWNHVRESRRKFEQAPDRGT